MAWVSYETGEIHDGYARTLELSRAALKDIRTFENKLGPTRDKRLEVKKRMDTLVAQKGDIAKIQVRYWMTVLSLAHHSTSYAQALHDELASLESHDAVHEASVEAMKRQKLRECYELQFDGLKAMGEKLSIL